MKKILTLIAGFLAPIFVCAEPPAAETDFFPGDFFAGAADARSTDVEVFAAASRVPAGGKFSLLVKITMEPGWHVYWKNPGEAGAPLEIEWTSVPAGAGFGEWRWSAPKFYELMGIASHVYEDVAFVEVPVRVPADAPLGTLAFAGTATWLACDDNGCYPQEKEFSARVEIVPAGEAAVPANVDVFAEAEGAFPRREPGLVGSVSENAGTVELFLKNFSGDAQPLSADARFFPESGKFAPSAAKTVPAEENGGLRFSLALNRGEKLASPAEAAGVLRLADGRAFELRGEDLSATPPAEKRGGNADAAGGEASPSAWFGFPEMLALAFAGGLILNLMPCVFPVLGLKIMHFVAAAGTDKKKIARHGFVFAAGVLVSFWILAGVLTILRSGGERLGWGFQLQEPMFVYCMILLLLVFGLSMSGVFEFGVGATSLGGNLARKSGYAGSFFSGVLAVVVATPCAAPFLAPALGSALTLPPAPSFVLFTAIACGLAAPYVALSCAPALLKFLPKPGAWMETFKQAMAFLLYAPALYFVWVLMGQTDDDSAQRDLLISLSVVALACWIYGKWAVVWRSRATRLTATAVAATLFAGTLIYAGTLLSDSEKSGEDVWIEWSPEAQSRALSEGKIVYVDFTARWCTTCQVNKRVYSDEALRKDFADAGVVKMRADWTNKNPTIAEELRKYGRAAVPVNVFLKKDRVPVVLGELFSGAETVSEGLRKIAAPAESDD